LSPRISSGLKPYRHSVGKGSGSARPTSQAGFTLLEAIVAITVLVAALVPLYTLISNVSRSAFRVDEANRRAEFETDALNILSTVNPMDTPAGSIDLGPYVVRWSAQPAVAPLDGSAYPSGQSAFRVGLYDTKVAVTAPDGRSLADFSLRMVGYKHVRDSLFK
jgi:general secretion pathway protein I